MIIVIRMNVDKVSGFPDIVLGDIYYNTSKTPVRNLYCLLYINMSILIFSTTVN